MIEAKRHKDVHGYTKGEYYYSPVVDGKEWSYVAETEDVALLLAIGIKYDGVNTQFAKMATRMLNIKSAWAD